MKTIVFMVITLLALAITSQAQHVKRVVITKQEITKVEGYHESDELVYRSEDYLIFLNQTSPVKDTLYVYTFGKPLVQCKAITKNKVQCKLRTGEASGYCHLHKQK